MKLPLIVAAAAALATGPAPAADGPRAALLETLAVQAAKETPGFAGFSAGRGRALYLGPHAGGKAESNACAVCHTPTPTAAGRHHKTGRDIPPMAVSVNPRRFTDPAEVEKRFERDCPNVLGRACTAQEKGDFITYLSGQ